MCPWSGLTMELQWPMPSILMPYFALELFRHKNRWSIPKYPVGSSVQILRILWVYLYNKSIHFLARGGGSKRAIAPVPIKVIAHEKRWHPKAAILISCFWIRYWYYNTSFSQHNYNALNFTNVVWFPVNKTVIPKSNKSRGINPGYKSLTCIIINKHASYKNYTV